MGDDKDRTDAAPKPTEDLGLPTPPSPAAGCRPRIYPRHRSMTHLPMDNRLAGNRERRSSAEQGSLTRAQNRRKPAMASAMTAACVSRAKCPVSRNRTWASGMSRRNASAPAGRKNGSFRPQIASSRGRCVRK